MFTRASRFLTLLIVLFGAAEARASGHIGPVAWSPGGESFLAYHHGKMAELPSEKGEAVPWTDSIPEPRAIAVDWERKFLAVSLPADTPRVELYQRGALEPVGMVCGLPARATHLGFDGALLLVGGPGFLEARRVPEGDRESSFTWEPPWDPVDLWCGEEGATLLLRDRLVDLGGEPSIRPLPAEGEPVALVGGDGAVGVIFVRGGASWCVFPGSPEARIGDVQVGEKLLGAAFAPATGLFLLSIHADPGPPSNQRSRLEVLDAATGRVAKRFRSARLAGTREILEDPLGAAFDPAGKRVGMAWRLARTQIWDATAWKLVAAY